MTERRLSAVARIQHTSDDILQAMHAMVEAAAKQGQVVGALLIVEHVSQDEEGRFLGKPKAYSVPLGDFAVRGLLLNSFDEIESEFDWRFWGRPRE